VSRRNCENGLTINYNINDIFIALNSSVLVIRNKNQISKIITRKKFRKNEHEQMNGED
jgi:hypothetical protein